MKWISIDEGVPKNGTLCAVSFKPIHHDRGDLILPRYYAAGKWPVSFGRREVDFWTPLHEVPEGE